MAVGATAVLMAERPTPDAVVQSASHEKKPTISTACRRSTPRCSLHPFFQRKKINFPPSVRFAGEALPAQLGKGWTERTGVEILDGIGSTEMLHIFLSQPARRSAFGTTGAAGPAMKCGSWTMKGHDVTQPGELGELLIRGTTRGRDVLEPAREDRGHLHGPVDEERRQVQAMDEEGYYVYGGRTDDMLKVSGIYVSPVEVEAALITHEAVLEGRRRRRRG